MTITLSWRCPLFTQERRKSGHAGTSASCQTQKCCHSFDHLVGAGEQRLWLGDAECLGSLQMMTSSNLDGSGHSPLRYWAFTAIGAGLTGQAVGRLNTATFASLRPSLLAVWPSQSRTTHRLATRSGTAMCTFHCDLHRATKVARPLVAGLD